MWRRGSGGSAPTASVFAPVLAAGLICLGVMGPAVNRGEGESFRNLDGVIYVMDISRSMTEDEIWQVVAYINTLK